MVCWLVSWYFSLKRWNEIFLDSWVAQNLRAQNVHVQASCHKFKFFYHYLQSQIKTFKIQLADWFAWKTEFSA